MQSANPAPAMSGSTAAQRVLNAEAPVFALADSELLRRKKVVVCGGQLATALLVAVAIAGTGAARFHQLSSARLIAMAGLGIIYIIWSLFGTRDAVQFVLWHPDLGPAKPYPVRGAYRSALHIAVQFGIAELIIWMAGSAGILGLLWLVLLPPISYVVMFHRPLPIILTATASIALHGANIVWWNGWPMVPLALPAFVVAVLFTLVFTQIAVSAEKARGNIERLAEELRDANEKLRAYALQAGELAATRERNRMAREIHDSLGHCLTVVHVQLEAAISTLQTNHGGAIDAIGKAQSMAHLGLEEVRRSVSTLRTSPLHDRPLPDALRQLISVSQVAGVNTEFVLLGDVRELSPQGSLTLYRTAQEGLTNCRKHSNAIAVTITLDYQLPEKVRLTVSDNGVGSDQTRDGFGLLGLRERAQLLGGSLQISTSPGNGFTLLLEVAE